MPSSTSSQYLQTLLDSARPFLRGELESIDENLPSLIKILRSVGAGECWHKHGSFLDHLVDMYRILNLWKAPHAVSLCGLFHSAYSNSYVNLAIFDPSTGREVVRGYVGKEAEHLIHLFCVVPRQPLIHDNLLFHYSDDELADDLKKSQVSLRDAKEKGVFGEESWRKKVQGLVPAEGLKVKHIRTGEDVHVSRRVVAVFIMMTMADFCDQLFSFQDMLFDNVDGRLEFKGNNFGAIWPGDGKPGLWLNSISRMGALYTLIVREEEILLEERKRVVADFVRDENERDEDIELVLPPVFENCTKVLDAEDQIVARDLYWEAVCDVNKEGLGRSEELLVKSIEKNPFVGEPYVVLSQVYLAMGRFEEAEKKAEKGLTLLLEWGCPWDKRVSWEGWISWSRVLLMKAKEKSWPHTSWGILNLGLVR